jgi:glycosyltransferase involved in cell wall biosynthesis
LKVCLLFKNFGPYHVARIAALSRQCLVLPIEISKTSSEYRWGDGEFRSFSRTTLLSAAESASAGQALIRDRLIGNLVRLAPDVLAVPGWYEPASLAAIKWARASNVPVVMMSESTRNDEHRYPHREFVKRQIVRMCSAAVVGGTPQAAYMQELGMEPSRIVDGYDVVDNDHFAHGAAAARNDSDSKRSEFQLPGNYFLASSRLIPRKNLLRLIAAYQLYRRQIGDGHAWHLVILGYGSQEPELHAEIERRGLQSWVSLQGFQPYNRVPTYYGLAGAFIHPALSEPWGLVVNEAMAAGLPPLVSKAAGCAADLVTDGETGFQFDPENVEQLGSLMAPISRDRELRFHLSKQAENRIREWSPTRFANNLLRVARTALDFKSEPAPFLARVCLQTLLHRAS